MSKLNRKQYSRHPRFTGPRWIPTTIALDNSPLINTLNLAKCENATVSQLALNAVKNISPVILISHWDSQDKSLRTKLANIHNVSAEQVFVTPGALAAIDYCFDIFVQPNSNVLLNRPDFPCYDYSADWAKAKVYWLENLTFPFSLDLTKTSQLIRKHQVDFFIFSNPNAVTGTRASDKEIEDLIKNHQQTMFVIDEADAADTKSHASLTNTYTNVVIIKSFSKYYGLAGLRIGALICHPSLQKYFTGRIDQTAVSKISIIAAIAVLDDKTYLVQTEQTIKNNRRLIETICNRTRYSIVPGSCCFAVYIWANPLETDPYIELQQNGIEIVKGDKFGLTRGGRINIASSENISKLAKTLKEIL